MRKCFNESALNNNVIPSFILCVRICLLVIFHRNLDGTWTNDEIRLRLSDFVENRCFGDKTWATRKCFKEGNTCPKRYIPLITVLIPNTRLIMNILK